MLRQPQPRPKSQPPSSVKKKQFIQQPPPAPDNGGEDVDEDEDGWNKLVARYKNVPDCKLINSNSSLKQELESSPASSSSSPSSSSSSLASSTLSLSTNGSTSTVMDALKSSRNDNSGNLKKSSLQTNTNGTITTTTTSNNKSMIARYSVATATTDTSVNFVSNGRPIRREMRESLKQHCQEIPHTKIPPPLEDSTTTTTSEEEEEEEEEDLNQPLSSTSSSASSTSSSSSSSFSSGLSSMNSANLSNASGGSQLSRHLGQQPHCLMPLVDGDGAIECAAAGDGSSNEVADEIGRCLEDLVDSVASGSSSSGSDDNEVSAAPYGTFQLHQALLAKTRSSTSASSDDDTTTIASNQGQPDTRVLVAPEVVAPAVPRTTLTAAAYLVEYLQPGSVEGAANCDQTTALVLRARKWANDEGTRQRRAPTWLVGLRPQEFRIEWRSLQPETGAGVCLDRVIDCIVDEQLVIWILTNRQLNVVAAASAAGVGKENGQAKGESEDNDELETTLDDIALALDEPIEKPTKATKLGDETLVWWCASESEARTFGDTYRSLIEEQFANSNYHQSTHGHEELKLNDRDIDSCLASPGSGMMMLGRDGDDASVAVTGNLGKRQLLKRQTDSSASSPTIDMMDDLVVHGSGSIGAIEKQKMLSKNVDNQQHQSSDANQTMKQDARSIGQSTTVLRRQTCNSSRHHHRQNNRNKHQQPVDDETPADCCSTLGQQSIGSELESASTATANLSKLPLVVDSSTDFGSATTQSCERETAEGGEKMKLAGSDDRHLIENDERGKTTTRGKDKFNIRQQAVTTKSATSAEPPVTAPTSAQAPGLASYYKSVASKVLSNGQNRIRSFKDEMIKFNNRMPATTTTTTTTKTGGSSSSLASSLSSSSSMLLFAPKSSVQVNKLSSNSGGKRRLQQQEQARSVLNLSLSDSNSTKIQKSSLEQVAGQKNTGDGHQHRLSVSMVAAKQKQQDAIDGQQHQHQVSSSRAAATATSSTDHQHLIPTVKPRTSILKNRNQPQQNNGCDINNNNNDNGCNNRMVAVDQFRIQRNDDAHGQQRSNRLLCNENQTQTSKPKSILKSSKSVSNLAAAAGKAEGHQIYHSTSTSRQQLQQATSNANSNSSLVSLNDRKLGSEELGSSGRQNALASGSSCLDIASAAGQQRRSCAGQGAEKGAHYYTMRPGSSYETKKRRSVAPDHHLYSVEGCQGSEDRRHQVEQLQQDGEEVEDDLEDDEDEQEAMNRQQAFERLRQRASCYDITRLMSKNGLQDQLSKLRAGSTNSIAGNSRQRRPALLISDLAPGASIKDEDMAHSNYVIHTNGRQANCAGRGMMNQAGSTIIQSTSASAADDTYSRGGQVVSAQGGRRHQRQVASNNDGPNSGDKDRKSEFDPRSLRRPPVGLGASILECGDARASSSISSSNKSPVNPNEPARIHKPMTSIIRLTGSSSTPHGNNSTSSRLNPMKMDEEKEEQQQERKRSRVSRDLTSVVPVDNLEKKQRQTDRKDDDDDGDNVEEDDAELTETEIEIVAPSAALSKSGPFSLLRQSFNQKTLSSMLKFSGRASLRIKSTTVAPAQTTGDDTSGCYEAVGAGGGSGSDKAAQAVAAAEANLMAAKQLKQQAQRLKEQHKREQQQQLQLHQQQQVPLDPASIMMAAAVQYNQRLQRQQHHQLMYHQHQVQQQYAAVAAARGQMFDASGVHLQHQMLIQRAHQQQQQHQLAYMANLNSTHYMAQQMVMAPNQMAAAAAAAAVAMGGPMGAAGLPAAAQQLMYGVGGAQVQANHPAANQPGLFRKSILKGSHKSVTGTNPELVYSQQHHQQQQQQQQQLIPMAVNHHSSFNIVYAGAPAPAPPQQMQPQPQPQQQPEQQQVHGGHQKKQAAGNSIKPATKSSLGASMRKTVKSILVNRSAFLSSSSSAGPVTAPTESATKLDSTRRVGQVTGASNSNLKEHKLKSALKSPTKVAARNEMALNSEGSDGDGSTSSSDSATVINGNQTLSSTVAKATASLTPKSALKNSLKGVVACGPLVLAPPSDSSSDSSCSSSPSSSTDGTINNDSSDPKCGAQVQL